MRLGGRDRARNVLIVMTLCGLWHGAGWNFVIWGLLHGLYIVLYRATRTAWDAFPVLVQQIATFALVSLAWTFFLFDASGAAQFLQSLAGFGGATLDAPGVSAWLLLGLAAAVCFGPALEPLAENRIGEFLWTRSVSLGLLAAVVLLYLDETEAFVYFRF